MKRVIVGLVLAGVVAGVVGCGKRTIRLDFVPSDEKLEEHTIETADAGVLTSDKVAMVTVSGMIANMKAKSMLSSGANPVSDFRQTLDQIAKDPSVKRWV